MISLNILLIEDNQELLTVLETILTLKGHRVLNAKNGFEGIEIAKEIKPDMIVCDLGLPIMNGLDVIKIIRETETLCSTIMVALSGYTSFQKQALESGFDYFIAKPLDMRLFNQIIVNIMDLVELKQ